MLAVLLAQSTDLSAALDKGGPVALGAGAVLLMGRLGWIRFPPSPEQVADKARLEALTDDLIHRQATALTDTILATREVTKAVEGSTSATARAELASAAAAAELARLTIAAAGIAAALAEKKP